MASLVVVTWKDWVKMLAYICFAGTNNDNQSGQSMLWDAKVNNTLMYGLLAIPVTLPTYVVFCLFTRNQLDGGSFMTGA